MKIGNVFQYLGISIIMISLIYLIVNLSNADSFVAKWAIFMSVGVLLTVSGIISLIIDKKQIKR